MLQADEEGLRLSSADLNRSDHFGRDGTQVPPGKIVGTPVCSQAFQDS